MGAVPVQDAKWLRSGNRAMSPTSARIRAAPAGPMPWMSIRCEPVARTAALSSAFIALELGVQAVQVLQFLRGHPAAGLPGQVTGPDGGQQRLVLADGFLHRRPAGQQAQKQPVHPVERLCAGAGQLITAAAASAAPSAPDRCRPRAVPCPAARP